MTKIRGAERSGGQNVQSPRRNGPREVGSLLPDVAGMAFRRFGFLQGALVARWSEVVGPVYVRWSVPQSLRFSRGRRNGGVLTVVVEGPFSVQLQHVAPQIIERANRILGHDAVARLRLVQGDVPKPADRGGRRPGPSGSPEPLPTLQGIRDEGLRKALEELAAGLDSLGSPPKIG